MADLYPLGVASPRTSPTYTPRSDAHPRTLAAWPIHAILARVLSALILLLPLFIHPPAAAQSHCSPQWRPSLLNGGLGPTPYASTVWDADGPGPATPLLVIGGASSSYWLRSVVVWDGLTWQALGTSANNNVRALTQFGSQLIAAGEFTVIGGVSANLIASWNGTVWQPLGSGVNGAVLALTVYRGDLIAAGRFDEAGGVSASQIARWDGHAWHPLGAGISGSPWGVSALGVHNDELFAGGHFTTAGGVSAARIARWNGETWQPVGGPVNYSAIFAITVYRGDLIAAGSFNSIGETPAVCVARWDGDQWHALGPGLNGPVRSLCLFGDQLWAGGSFSDWSWPRASLRVAFWDGVSWRATGVSPSGNVLTMTAHAGDIWAGGDFGLYGGMPSSGLARWGSPPPECRVDFNCSGVADLNDFSVFLHDWFSRSPPADFNDNGGFDIADVFAFFAAWLHGCP